MEENNNPGVKSIALKYGAINGLLGIIFLIIFDLLADNQSIQWIGIVVFLVLLILAHREFKKEGDGYMSYGQGLGIGTLAAVISGVVSNLFFCIYVKFINIDFIEAIKEKTIQGMEEGGMGDAEIDQAMELMGIILSPVVMAITGFIVGVFIGFLISLIVSAFTKNQRPEFS